MIELCGLQMSEDEWPDDIDSRIAALNFGGGDSVLFESFDPAVSTDSLDSQQLRQQCRMKKDDFQLAFADSGHWQSGINEMTTWGRIKTSEPFDDRTASAPDFRKEKKSEAKGRPNSLIANFVNGDNLSRFVDVNENEIEQNTQNVIRKDRWRRSMHRKNSAPRRTFADLDKDKNAPKLEFLAMHHEMPSLCSSFTQSFRDVIIKTQKEALPSVTLSNDFPLIYQQDSGLGCSGPAHIEDWPSLSVLLPKHVVDACSFFKTNAQLLSSDGTNQSTSNCIDRRFSETEACRTCYGVRRRIHPPIWAQTKQTKQVLCDCANSTESKISFAPTTSTARHQLRAKELSIVGLPIYSEKRILIENIVESVAAISRGENVDQMVLAMRRLIEDGLKSSVNPWQMIKTVTSKGPATKDVHSIVRQLDECDKPSQVKVEIFFEELVRENSLDCWLCYIVLKEKVLKKLYDENSFLVSACGEYRTLLWRMVDSLSLLPVIGARIETTKSTQHWGGASPVASDSRVPKSSSVPSRLSSSPRKSRIPIAIHSHKTMNHQEKMIKTRIASLKQDFKLDNFSLKKNEKVRVISTRSGMARCQKITKDHENVNNGVCPVEYLEF